MNQLRISITLALVGLIGISSTSKPYTPEFLNHTAQNYLTSFGVIPASEKPADVQKSTFDTLFSLKDLPVSSISDHEYRTLALQAAPLLPLSSASLIDTTFVDKLELAKGGEIPSCHLTNILSTYGTTSLVATRMGKQALISILTQPTDDLNLLQKRQLISAELIGNPALLNYCTMIFSRMQEHEQSLIGYYQETKELDEILKQIYFSDVFGALNKSTLALEASTRSTQFFSGLSIALLPAAAALTFALRSTIFDRSTLKDFRKHKGLIISYGLFVGGLHTLTSTLIIKQLNLHRKLSNHLQNQLIGVASYVECARHLIAAISQHPYLYDLMKEMIIPVQALVTGSGNHSADLKELIEKLSCDTFKGDASFFSSAGRVLATHKLMVQTKNEFAYALTCLGYLEAFVGVTQNFQLHAGKNNPYCFVEFIQKETPCITAIDFWNPFIPSSDAIANSIELGSTGHAQNIILTGPNTGGKSVLIKGLLINILLAQTFGIAAAKELKMTPFAKLNCYLNITDNIAEGVSLFKAEVLRAKSLINGIKALKPHEFCFTIMDEVFCGTAPQEGEQAAYIFSKQLGNFTNTINIIATHYPKMPDLEQETKGIFKNYHIEVLRDQQGKIKRTFKLKEGKSHMNIAMDILREEGVIT